MLIWDRKHWLILLTIKAPSKPSQNQTWWWAMNNRWKWEKNENNREKNASKVIKYGVFWSFRSIFAHEISDHHWNFFCFTADKMKVLRIWIQISKWYIIPLLTTHLFRRDDHMLRYSINWDPITQMGRSFQGFHPSRVETRLRCVRWLKNRKTRKLRKTKNYTFEVYVRKMDKISLFFFILTYEWPKFPTASKMFPQSISPESP